MYWSCVKKKTQRKNKKKKHPSISFVKEEIIESKVKSSLYTTKI